MASKIHAILLVKIQSEERLVTSPELKTGLITYLKTGGVCLLKSWLRENSNSGFEGGLIGAFWRRELCALRDK